ncbi:MAG: hypothetical protein U0271_39235 [Polyangiaceae bacterium]
MSDVQAELAKIELAEKDARGSALVELFSAREKLLEERGAELLGGVAPFAKRWPNAVTFREGFVDSVVRPAEHKAEGKLVDALPLSSLLAAFELPAFARCRAITSNRWRGAPPASTERLAFWQTVITEELMALENLRELRAGRVVASVPLSHPRLEKLTVTWAGPIARLLKEAKLPALKMLAVMGLGRRTSTPAAVADAIASLPAETVFLEVQGKVGPHGWGTEELRALEPVANRIEGLQWSGTPAQFDVALPKLRRLWLDLHVMPARHSAPTTLPELSVDELALFARGRGAHLKPLATQLAASDLVAKARVLHLRAPDRVFLSLFDKPLEHLEELSYFTGGTIDTPVSNELLQKDAFPRVRRLSLFEASQLEGLASSALAARIEELSVGFMTDRCVASWVAVRKKLTKLRTLVVRGGRGFGKEARAALYDGDHQVIWAENDSEAARRFLDIDRGDPGMVAFH